MDVVNLSCNWWYQYQKLHFCSTLKGVGFDSMFYMVVTMCLPLVFQVAVPHLSSSNRQKPRPLCCTYTALFTFLRSSRPLLCDDIKKKKSFNHCLETHGTLGDEVFAELDFFRVIFIVTAILCILYVYLKNVKLKKNYALFPQYRVYVDKLFCVQLVLWMKKRTICN